MATKRNIQYLNRDFDSFRTQLIQFTQTYFPNTYNDFSPASPGMLFMEQAAYIGDVLSFYLDTQLQETFIQYAQETKNIYELAYLLGYKPKNSTAAITTVDIYQRIPAIAGAPDFTYALTVPSNTTITAPGNPNISFLTQDVVDFNISSSLDPTETSIYQIDTGTGQPTSYLLKKSVQAISATIKTTTYSFGTPTPFTTVQIADSNILGILDIVDSDGNSWYEVSHLGQDSIYDSVKNTNQNDPNFSTDSNVPFLLQTKQIQRRFATRVLDKTTLQIQFGAGNPSTVDEEIVPNPNNVGLGLPSQKDKLTTAFSPTNYIFTNTYGISPANTTLTVRYITGGGIGANIGQNILTSIDTSGIYFNTFNLSSVTANEYFNSIQVTNPVAASGGQGGDSIEEIRQNSLATFQNQLRTVTADDYLLRALSLPPQYGTVAKAYAQAQKLTDLLPGEIPSSVDLYVLGYDVNKNLVPASEALKQNLRTYLSEYRIINDSVKIKDAYVINIGVDFEIITYPNYNNNQVLVNCIAALKTYFNIDKWQINEPILVKDLFILLDQIEGVQTVKTVNLTNKTGPSLGYSDYSYDVPGATKNGVVYPSLDPMIFEVKYPNSDIKGKVVPL